MRRGLTVMTSLASSATLLGPAQPADAASSAPFGHARALTCRECGASFDLGGQHACSECFGPLEVSYDLPPMTRRQIEAGPPNIWRYASLLPVRPDIAQRPNTEPGRTRLIRADGLAAELGMRRLWIKDERANPTHSFKDRVVAVALAAAVEMGYRVLACPSTGNLANAVAAAAARAGIESVVLVPANLEPEKIFASAVYGGMLVKIDKAFREFASLGLVPDTAVTVYGAQASGCAPVAAAFAAGADVVQPVRPDTIAKSLAIGNPAD